MASTVPAAIDGILALLTASTTLAGVTIFDGEPTTDTPKDFIAIGFVPDGGTIITGSQTALTMSNAIRDESYGISCRVSAWNGSTVMKSVRDRAYALFASVETVLRASPTLSAAVTFAEIAPVAYDQYQTEQGAVADIDFTVSVRAAGF